MNLLDYILLPFARLLELFYNITGSYGLALIFFCLVFKIILFPISLKGRKSMIDMSSLADEQKRLQQKYIRDRQKYSEELAALYERENVKPSSGCLWSLLPFPLMLALYAIIREPLTHLMRMTGDQINNVATFLTGDVIKGNYGQLSLAQPFYERYNEAVQAFPDLAGIPHVDFTFLGVNLSSVPDIFFFQKDGGMTWNNIGLFLIPVLSAVLSYLSMIVTNRTTKRVQGTTNAASDAQTRMMSIMMPLMSLWICFTVPAGLGIYWISNSVFAILQEFVSLGFLKKYVANKKEVAARRAEEQRLKEKEQKRLAVELRQKAQEEAKRIKMERKLNNSVVTESRVGIRAYARGRTYDPERYPVTKYVDPDVLAKERAAAAAAAAEQAALDKAQGKKKPKEENKRKKRGLAVEPVVEPVMPERPPEVSPQDDAAADSQNTES